MIDEISISNLTTNQELLLNYMTTPRYILSSVDWSQIQINYEASKAMNQLGETFNALSLEPRDVEVIGTIIAMSENEMSELKKYLNGMFSPFDEFKLTYKDKYLNFNLTKTVEYGKNLSENNEVICKFRISGIAQFPLFKLIEQRLNKAWVTPSFTFPFSIDEVELKTFGIVGENQIILIDYASSIPSGFKVVVKAKNAQVSGFKLQHIQTGTFIEFSDTLGLMPGDILEFSTESGNRYASMRTADGYEYDNMYSSRTLNSGWPQLAKGLNYFTYSVADGFNVNNIDVEIIYSELYSEVEEW